MFQELNFLWLTPYKRYVSSLLVKWSTIRLGAFLVQLPCGRSVWSTLLSPNDFSFSSKLGFYDYFLRLNMSWHVYRSRLCLEKHNNFQLNILYQSISIKISSSLKFSVWNSINKIRNKSAIFSNSQLLPTTSHPAPPPPSTVQHHPLRLSESDLMEPAYHEPFPPTGQSNQSCLFIWIRRKKQILYLVYLTLKSDL